MNGRLIGVFRLITAISLDRLQHSGFRTHHPDTRATAAPKNLAGLHVGVYDRDPGDAPEMGILRDDRPDSILDHRCGKEGVPDTVSGEDGLAAVADDVPAAKLLNARDEPFHILCRHRIFDLSARFCTDTADKIL